MANYCYYDLQAYGFRNEKEKDFFIGIFNEYYFTERPRYYLSLYGADVREYKDGVVQVDGGCKWSVHGSMMNYDYQAETDKTDFDSFIQVKPGECKTVCLEQLSKVFGIIIEVYSEEEGCEFQEHYVIRNGKVIVSENCNWESYDTCDCFKAFVDEYANGVEKDSPVSKEEYERQMSLLNDRISVGGFENWSFDYIKNELNKN